MAGYRVPRGPGKSAPRLVNDLLDYDPRYQAQKGGRNLLLDDAPQYREGRDPPLPPRKGDFDCRHQLMLKQTQTVAPASDDEEPDSNSKYVVSTYCQQCRWYFDLTVDYTHWKEDESMACQPVDPDGPLHHFRLVESIDTESLPEYRGNKYKPVVEIHQFVCSGNLCPAKLEIAITPPRLTADLLGLILNSAKVVTRGKREIEAEPERYEGLEPLVPIQVLGYLRQYLSDAWAAKGATEGKRIAKRNKKYMLAFGPECETLFEYLDFDSIRAEKPGSEEPDHFWRLPQITDLNSEFLQDVDVELQLKILERPVRERETPNYRKIEFMPVAAQRYIARSLRYVDYPKSIRSRTVDLSIPEHPHYASLGVMDDFSDDLISWAYDRQCLCDPENKPYYLDCLAGIAKGRTSADLETKVVLAESAGEYGQKAIEDAYNFFGLDSKTREGDDHIMGLYKSRIESAPRQKDEARNCLLIISKARSSDKIAALANDRVMSFDEAMEFLNVSNEVPPDMIIASAIAISSDGDATKAARALRVVANKLGDRELQQAATDMESGTAHMPIDEAYRRLQIHDRMASEETIFAYYQHLIKDAPATRTHFAEALRAIAVEKSSNYLFAKLDDPNAVVAPARSTSDQPIGLDNIGNTCYLNSLLQYYYTIKAIRNLAMNFQDHRMPLSEDDIRKKRVGGRSVSKTEIIKAQKFVDELHDLFENLKTASTRSIKPTRDLAELTIFSSAAAANFRRASISSPQGPLNISSLSESPVYGPQPRPLSPPTHPSPMPNGEDIEMIDHPSDKLENESQSSEATLVEMDGVPTLPTYSEAIGDDVMSSEKYVKGDDDQRFVSNNRDQEGDAIMVNGDNTVSDQKILSAPEKPPPVPPRNKSGLVIQTSESKDLISDDDLWKFGSQQDVTEVIGNVMFRLQCAIKPTSIDERSGEQIDIVRDTFYGSIVVYSQKAQTLERKVEAVANFNVFPAPSGSRDIYEALDVFFDEQLVDIDDTTVPQYSSIHKLPPILQIQIQRTAFDSIKKVASKNQNPVTFPETIYLDRYMDSEDPASILMRRRRETWKWKEELRKLEARRDALKGRESEIAVPDALVAAKDYVTALQEEQIEGIPIEAGFTEALEERVVEVVEELEIIDENISGLKQNLNEQFTDMNRYGYKLQTVFIHRGEAGGGHYWIYIYDFENDVWRKYNDDRVDIVTNRKEIFEPQRVVDGTPYYLVYVRSEERKELVEAVCRDVPDPLDMTDTWAGEAEMDGGLIDDSVGRVEYVKPQPLRPSANLSTTSSWETDPSASADANGNPW